MSTKLVRYPTHLRVTYGLELQSTDGKRVPFGELVLDKSDHITTIVVFSTWTPYRKTLLSMNANRARSLPLLLHLRSTSRLSSLVLLNRLCSGNNSRALRSLPTNYHWLRQASSDNTLHHRNRLSFPSIHRPIWEDI